MPAPETTEKTANPPLPVLGYIPAAWTPPTEIGAIRSAYSTLKVGQGTDDLKKRVGGV